MKKVFISYAHQDAALKDELVTHLGYPRSIGLIDDWHDSGIDAGDNWRAVIYEHLNAADIIVLLISSDFLVSEYCREVELKIALRRWEKKDAEIVPVLIRDCVWEKSPLRSHQMLPSDAKPVARWPYRDEAWKEVAEAVCRLATRAALSTPPAGEADPNAGRADSIDLKDLEAALHQCDRHDQEDDLEDAVARHRAAAPRRPLVCLLHGEENECHPEFVNRLVNDSLPRLLGNWHPGALKTRSCVRYMLRLTLDRYTPGNVQAAIKREMSAARAGLAWDVYKTFADRELLCLLLNFTVFADDCSPRNLRRLEEFLRYWSGIDDLPPDRLLIVCMNFRYLGDRTLRKSGKWFLRRWQIERRNHQVRKLVNELGGREYPGISLATLSELKTIEQRDVEALISLEERLQRPFILRAVHELFSKKVLGAGYRHVQMGDLIDYLVKSYQEELTTPL
jgi:hypothetical protein